MLFVDPISASLVCNYVYISYLGGWLAVFGGWWRCLHRNTVLKCNIYIWVIIYAKTVWCQTALDKFRDQTVCCRQSKILWKVYFNIMHVINISYMTLILCSVQLCSTQISLIVSLTFRSKKWWLITLSVLPVLKLMVMQLSAATVQMVGIWFFMCLCQAAVVLVFFIPTQMTLHQPGCDPPNWWKYQQLYSPHCHTLLSQKGKA